VEPHPSSHVLLQSLWCRWVYPVSVQHADFFQFFAGQLNDWNGTGKTDLPSSYGAIESCHSETSTKGVRYWHKASRKSGNSKDPSSQICRFNRKLLPKARCYLGGESGCQREGTLFGKIRTFIACSIEDKILQPGATMARFKAEKKHPPSVPAYKLS